MRFGPFDPLRSDSTDDENVVLLVGGDADSDAGQRGHDAADVLAAEEDDARIVRPGESFDVLGQLRLRGNSQMRS